jgi:Carboxypeptidase regulatory-like domain/TonB dependent receptor
MKLRVVSLVLCLLFVAMFAFGQVGNGTITGTVTDQAGAVVAGAKIEAKNSETGVVYPAASTGSGNYTITDLPVGTYTVTVTVMGFKTYTHSNLGVQAAGTVREDVPLQVGANTESVTVTAEASLLKVDSGELAHNVTVSDMDQLPLLGVGTVNSGTSGYRNPYNTLLTLPGVSNYTTSGTFQVNGMPAVSATETMRVEGQDATVRLFGAYDYTQLGQPGADSIQEIAYQVSNYAPEFGQAGQAVINMTMKGGTNQYHGSGYDYFVNEDLNAGDPFSKSGGVGSKSGGDGGKFRPRNRRNDFGGTLGGPIYIPKIYNGHNKSFFFWSYEQYAETTLLTFTDTVPYQPFTTGDFSSVSANGTCSLCGQYGIPTTALPAGSGPTGNLDPQGRVQYANEIYDPLTRGVNASNNLGYANPFQNNMIPASRIDRVSAIFQAEFPSPTTSNLLSSNYNGTIPSVRYSAIPSLKIDHNISAKDKLSFYYSENNTQSQVSTPLGNADGLPINIGQYRGTFIPTYIERLNYDRTITPTILLHLGVGYQHTRFDDHAPILNYNAQQAIGISGFLLNRNIPEVQGMTDSTYGGMQNIGPPGQTTSYDEKASTTANLTWVHGKHTFKFGGEVYFEGTITQPHAEVTFLSGTNATSEPFLLNGSDGGFGTGFNYASFLLGDYNSVSQGVLEDYRYGFQTWALYGQDSWKVTRKLTLDYGLRWDYNTVEHEQYNRIAQFSESIVNTNAGNHLGGTLYCNQPGANCYQKGYPWAFGPRIGAAYQLDPKTVLRAGFGLVYQFVANPAGGLVSVSGTNAPAGINSFVNIEGAGAVPIPIWPVQANSTYCGIGCTQPNSIYPNFGTTVGAPVMPDANQNRPPRVEQYSLGIQREITRDFILEASYVGNMSEWIPGPLGFLSQISAQDYANYGLFPIPGTGPCASNPLTVCASSSYNNNADRSLLSQPVNSTNVEQRMKAIGVPNGGLLLPYTSASPTTTLAQAITPYSQFTGAFGAPFGPANSPTGDSKYNSLQIKATKRFSHNLQAGGAFTWGKGFTRAGRSDFYNPNISVWDLENIPPRILNFNAIYTVPKASYLNKWENQITQGWQIGFFGNYQTGTFLTPPTNYINAEQLNGEETLVPGQSFYTSGVNINNHSTFSPYYTQVLNPNAWAPCPTNTVCTASGTLYPGFRGPRMPTENANIGRNFRIKERMNFQIRGEFVNIFNRTIMPNPSTTNPQNALVQGGTINGTKVYTSGFGTMNAYAAPSTAPPQPLNGFTPVYQVYGPRTGTLIARFTF